MKISGTIFGLNLDKYYSGNDSEQQSRGFNHRLVNADTDNSNIQPIVTFKHL